MNITERHQSREPYPGGGTGAFQVDGGITARRVMLAIVRQLLLVRAPPQLGRLAALAHEALDGPCV